MREHERDAGCGRRHFVTQLMGAALAGSAALQAAPAAAEPARTSADAKPKEKVRMKARITVITIGVDDLERSLRFYRDGLGLATPGIVGSEFEHGAVAFFDLQSGLKLAIWPRRSIAHDAGVALGAASATEFTLGHNLASKAEVDAVMKQAAAAGATLVQPARDTFWGGYAGYFKDPDGHLWEALYNPQLLPAD
jgi:catechol 2,3-dioxygenase-like lactoylglutathione lyase family enzyme